MAVPPADLDQTPSVREVTESQAALVVHNAWRGPVGDESPLPTETWLANKRAGPVAMGSDRLGLAVDSPMVPDSQEKP